MEAVMLVRYAEIHLKGLNRPYFEVDFRIADEHDCFHLILQIRLFQLYYGIADRKYDLICAESALGM